VRKKLDDHLNEEFWKQVLMEVTKRLNGIMEDIKLNNNLVSIDVDNEFNKQVSKRPQNDWYKDMEA
jgi:hypothetical protein